MISDGNIFDTSLMGHKQTCALQQTAPFTWSTWIAWSPRPLRDSIRFRSTPSFAAAPRWIKGGKSNEAWSRRARLSIAWATFDRWNGCRVGFHRINDGPTGADYLSVALICPTTA